MGWIAGPVVYLLIWWVILFAVLPWGNDPTETPVTGHATSAPAKPRLARKFIATTILAAIIWLSILLLMKSHIISFDSWADQMIKEGGVQ